MTPLEIIAIVNSTITNIISLVSMIPSEGLSTEDRKLIADNLADSERRVRELLAKKFG